MLKTNCSVKNCQNQSYKSGDKCVLHCEKNSYEYHSIEHGEMISEFYDALSKYMASYIYNLYEKGSFPEQITEPVILKYIISDNFNNEHHKDTQNYINNATIVFDQICFPFMKLRDPNNYYSLIGHCHNIHFRLCSFKVKSGLNSSRYKLFYDECTFWEDWSVSNNSILENDVNVLYQSCTFKKAVSIYTPDDLKPYTIESSLFSDCTFEISLELNNSIFMLPVFNNSSDMIVDINNILISQCVFEEKFILNKLNANLMSVKDSEFKSKVEFKEGCIQQAKISNTNFEKLFDAFGTKYKSFTCFKSIFSDFVGFEKCKFGTSLNDDIPTFQYSTFLSFTNFRKTEFSSGLDLEEANFKEPPNFLNIVLEPNRIKSIKTSRETLRIIKYSFDKLSNQIEANKFFVLEMKKHRQDLSINKSNANRWERFILWLNYVISDFGQSYIRPIVLYLIFGLIYYLLTLGQKNNLLYKIFPPINICLSNVSDIVNQFALSLLPFKSFLRAGMELLSLFFYIIFAILTWQIITAVKRYTKR